MLKKFISLAMCFILILSLSQKVFAEEESHEGKVRLGGFIIEGLEANNGEAIPTWFEEYRQEYESAGSGEKISVYAQTHELWVTKQQAAEVTKLYGNDLMPLMYTPEELAVPFSDFAGIEYLTNLETVGSLDSANTNGINSYPFSREQIGVYYESMVKAFRAINVKELLPKLELVTLRSDNHFPYDKELREFTVRKIEDNKNKVIDKIKNSSLTEDKKTKLKDELNAKVEEAKEKIKQLNAYDLSTTNFESDIEKETGAAITEVEKKIEEELNAPVEKFRKDHEEILLKDENSVTQSDEVSIDRALSDYNNLSETNKEKLSVEKAKLDRMKDNIEEFNMANANVKLNSNVEVMLGSGDKSVILHSSQEKPLTLPGANYYIIDENLEYRGIVPGKQYVLYALLKEKQPDGTFKIIKAMERQLFADNTDGSTTISIFSKFEEGKEYVVHDYVVPLKYSANDSIGFNPNITFRLAFTSDVSIAPERAEEIINNAKIKYVHETEVGDFSQSLKVKASSIKTNVKNGESIADGTAPLKVSDKLDSIKDVLTYNDLIPNTKYEVKGAIIDYDNYSKLSEEEKETFNPFIVPSEDEDLAIFKKYVVAQSEVLEIDTHNSVSGNVDVLFKGLKLEKNKKYVIFEKVSSKDMLIQSPNLFIPISEDFNEEEAIENSYREALPVAHSVEHFDIKDLKQTFETDSEINILVSKKWSDNSTDKEVTIKLLKKKPTIVINTGVEGWEEEEIDIGMRSMPIIGSLTVLRNTGNETSSEENIPEGYEFVKGEDGQPIILTLNNENSYSGVFQNLPKYEKDGKTLAEYKVYEVKVKGYTTSISGDQEKGFVVTNTATEKRSIPVSKKWIGKEENGAVIHLYADGEDTGKKVELNRENNWQHVFTDLEKYKDDVEIIYTVKEDVIDGYTTDISGDMENGYIITNTNIEKVSVTGSKTWSDNNNQDGKRPANITIRLLANGVEKSSKEISEADGWKWIFDNLPKYDNGQEIRYTISEDPIAGYTSEIKGYDVTNSYTPGKTSVQVNKVWKDGDNQDGKRPEKVVVKLFANGEETDKSVELKESNNWMAVFDELDEYQGGKKIVYTVQEENVSGYEVSVAGDATKGFTITNSYTPETVSINGSKTWSDNNNQDGKRPANITIRLLANGVEKSSKEISEADGWKWIFDNLPKYDNGQEIRYTISEDPIAGYTSEIKGYDVTNSYVQDKPDKPNKPNTSKEKELPKTGDGTNILSYALLLVLSGSILSGFAVRKKKINN